MENINEGRHQVKRKYGDYNRIRVNENGASVRDTIIKFVGKNYVTEEDLHNQLVRLEEDRGGTKVNKAKWFKRNQKFFTTFEKRGNTYYSLSKYGQRVLEMISKRDAPPAVNESTHRNIPSMSEYIAVNEESAPKMCGEKELAEMMEMCGSMHEMMEGMKESSVKEYGTMEAYESLKETYEMMKEMYS